ncbi:PTS sugar transporter subunit IIA [Exiguobacterium aurantiacum]|uniref:Phosphoenolpyruvate-dependent sugar phosphotransferase system, EIIA 2 n=1 Tax=Exiguobacterium aurantiacum TaxID=33987 RepID=A0A377FWP1_9BACL|nr:PTS sugar transporter subunit IIA [Exiguobacterium aurantiacum]STO08916.1 Phosphoenolpyruvate-dependent sugar phosphotransferase system, EIIA 2 [Exiguobacterium aurantiacum]
MCRFITEWMDTNWMWVTDQPTFERAVRAIGLELEGRGIVTDAFTRAVLEQERTIPSGVSDVAVPVAVIDVPRHAARLDGITLLHVNHPFDVGTIAGEPVRAEMMFIVTATTDDRKESYHKLLDDLLMDDEALQALVHVQSRSGLYHLQTMDLKAFSS